MTQKRNRELITNLSSAAGKLLWPTHGPNLRIFFIQVIGTERCLIYFKLKLLMQINFPFPIISMNFKCYIFSKNSKGGLYARNYAKFSTGSSFSHH